MKKVHGLRPEQFCNRILQLMAGSDKDTFEFYKDSAEGKFLKLFRNHHNGNYAIFIETGSKYLIWKLDNKVKMIISNITVEISRSSLIGVLNKNIDDANDYLISRYKENVVLLRKVSDPKK